MLHTLAALGLMISQLFPSLGPLPIVERRQAPSAIKAIYITSRIARHPRMAELRQLVRDTELNAVVINTKEPWGAVLDDELKQLVTDLHSEGVWVIARHVVMQDDDLAKRHPELALQRANGTIWRDGGGHTWVDPASPEVHTYNIEVALDTLALGFDEINLDYIRFPTDGDVKAIRYPSYDGKTGKAEVLTEFLKKFRHSLKTHYPDVLISADVFGESFIKDSDVGMGQRIKLLAPMLDALAPMLYPSHYRSGNFGLTNPAANPYKVVRGTLEKGTSLLAATPNVVVRPWLQDFNLGAVYTAGMVRAQITATEDAGYHNGFMLWNPRNIYSGGALEKVTP